MIVIRIFVEYFTIKFHRNPFGGSTLVCGADGRAGRTTKK